MLSLNDFLMERQTELSEYEKNTQIKREKYFLLASTDHTVERVASFRRELKWNERWEFQKFYPAYCETECEAINSNIN